jgi:hypothetical protein
LYGGAVNIAPEATASASSEAGSSYSAASAIDECIDGYPGDSSCEWVASYTATKVGGWLELNWDEPRVVDRIVLYDRPNSNDRITAATITMSDGTSLTVGPLNNDGSATEYTFPAVEITWLRLTVDSVRGNVGLSEIEVYESPDVNHTPVADAGTDQTVSEGETVVLSGSGSDSDGDTISYEWAQISGISVTLDDAYVPNPTFDTPVGLSYHIDLVFQLTVSDGLLSSTDDVTIHVIATNPTNTAPVADAGSDQTVSEGAVVYLDGSGSADGDGDTLTYQWTQAGGTTVSLSDSTSATPDFTAPEGLGADEVLTFELVVDDGQLSSAAASVSVTVQPLLYGGAVNIAPEATASASSEAGSSYSAASAIDECIDGYPGDSSCEWVASYTATKVGGWLELNWDEPRVVDRIVLYDRPNSNDRITAATITMSDGTSLTVGPLNNDGSATEYTFPAVEITWLRLTVDSVRGNVGLSEIEVYEAQ